MHWKIERDPYLSKLAAKHGEEAALQAGFFFDEDPEDAPLDDVDWRCTPAPRLRSSGERPAVLLATGGFCPVHDGHLAMMQSARAAAETAGFDVLGGYLSPGHDAYLTLKAGSAAIPSSTRLRSCAEAAAATDWLSVDPWEALHRRVSVNYTDVTARLRAYLRAHVDPRMEVVFVCGADNARFGLAFVEEGACVIVGRPGAEAELASFRARLRGEPRVLWAEGSNPAMSRTIRRPTWFDDRARRLVLRVGDVRSLEPGLRADFEAALTALLRQHVEVRTSPVTTTRLDDGVLSLDALSDAAHAVGVSRLYALGGYQLLRHVARPGSPPLLEQVRAIPPGPYVLHDDDRMTGATLAAVQALLPAHVRVVATRFAVPHDDDEDVADSRDFLLGAQDAGLVVELPDGTTGRAPYALPYVDPTVRCSIPPPEGRTFSKAIWALNERVHRSTGSTVGDLPAPARATFGWFGAECTLERVCRWHVERLERTT